MMNGELTDAVTSVVGESESSATLTVVRTDRVITRALTAAVICRTLVHV